MTRSAWPHRCSEPVGCRNGTPRVQVIRQWRSDGCLLADRLGCGGEYWEVSVGLAGRGRVVGRVNVEYLDRVQPARRVAQFVAGELGADIGEVEARVVGCGLEDAVDVVDAVVKGLVIGAGQA